MNIRKLVHVTILLLLTSISTKAHPSWGIVVTKDGEILFVDVMHGHDGTLWHINAKHNRITEIENDLHAHNLTIDNKGQIWCAVDIWREGEIEGEGHHYLLKYYPDKQMFDTLLFTEDEDTFFGNNFVLDSSCQKVIFTIHGQIFTNDLNGNIRQLIKHTFKRVNTFSINNGTLWITDKDYNNGSLYSWSSNSDLILFADSLMPQHPNDPIFDEERHQIFYGIGFTDNNNPILTDNTTRTLRVVYGDDSTKVVYHSDDNWHPIGITRHNDKYYVMESGWRSIHMGPRITILDNQFNPIERLDINTDSLIINKTNVNSLGKISQKDNIRSNKSTNWLYYLLIIPIAIIIGRLVRKQMQKKSQTSNQ